MRQAATFDLVDALKLPPIRGLDSASTVVGHVEELNEALVDAVNVAAGLVRSPLALAFRLEAAGAVALERCGAILGDRIAATATEAVS